MKEKAPHQDCLKECNQKMYQVVPVQDCHQYFLYWTKKQLNYKNRYLLISQYEADNTEIKKSSAYTKLSGNTLRHISGEGADSKLGTIVGVKQNSNKRNCFFLLNNQTMIFCNEKHYGTSEAKEHTDESTR